MISYLQGGLGNQLFQYAAGYAAAKRFAEPFQICTLSCEADGYGRHYELFNFPISAKPTCETGSTVAQEGWAYKPIEKSGMLLGYWQSEKFFDKCSEAIRNEFRMCRFPIHDNAVAVHVRRDRYNPKVFNLLDIEYYERARALMPSSSHFVMFTDSPEWCQRHIPWAWTVEPTGTTFDDFRLMASFKRHIIANSTYSWWAAWLGNGWVIAPNQWFMDGRDESDMIPERWENIPVDRRY